MWFDFSIMYTYDPWKWGLMGLLAVAAVIVTARFTDNSLVSLVFMPLAAAMVLLSNIVFDRYEWLAKDDTAIECVVASATGIVIAQIIGLGLYWAIRGTDADR